MMKIISSNHIYSIIANLNSGAERQTLLARNEKEASFLLIEIKNAEAIRKLTPVFLSFMDNKTFSDFIESFTFKDRLYGVFTYKASKSSRPIVKALAGTPPMVRVEALRQVIGQLMAQNMPYSVMCDILRSKNLLCAPDGRVCFVYDLWLRQDYYRDYKNKAMIMLADLTRNLFADIHTPGLQRFIDALEKIEFSDMEDVYREFAAISDQVATAVVSKGQRSTLRQRLLRQIYKLQKRVLPALPVAVLFAALTILFYLFYHTVIAPTPVDNGITEIGTVEIYDGFR